MQPNFRNAYSVPRDVIGVDFKGEQKRVDPGRLLSGEHDVIMLVEDPHAKVRVEIRFTGSEWLLQCRDMSSREVISSQSLLIDEERDIELNIEPIEVTQNMRLRLLRLDPSRSLY